MPNTHAQRASPALRRRKGLMGFVGFSLLALNARRTEMIASEAYA
jgi:hypothetical protein